jgi:hypothetical protein
MDLIHIIADLLPVFVRENVGRLASLMTAKPAAG